jgi:hypothetical protein
MKINTFFSRVLFTLCLLVLIIGCDDDDETAVSVDFGALASTSFEAEGATVTIPFRNANASVINNIDIEFGGTAIEGEDFELVGVTAEGVQIKIINDNYLEMNETIRIQMSSPGINLTGNSIHTLTIVSNCEDLVGLKLSDFVGDYDAIEKYGPNPLTDWAAPYHLVLVQDETDPAKFWMDNFYGVGRDAYILVDIAAGTAYFPNQTPLPDNSPNPLSQSTGTFSFCTGPKDHLALTINLNYDGGDWVYDLVKH